MLIKARPVQQFPDMRANYTAMVQAKAEEAEQAHLEAVRQAQAAETAKQTAQAVRSVPVAPAPVYSPPVTLGGSLLDRIARCESSGNPRATNGSHFGLFQFDLGTWQSVGGTGNPMDASPSEQYSRAQTLLNSRGTQPWDASRYCWN